MDKNRDVQSEPATLIQLDTDGSGEENTGLTGMLHCLYNVVTIAKRTD